MLVAVDVHYVDRQAFAACICFEDWADSEPTDIHTEETQTPSDYEPGQFYRRELPCVLSILNSVRQQPDVVIIDGFVYLGADEKPGLGKHLYDALDQSVAVIGVAKNSFRGTPNQCAAARDSGNVVQNVATRRKITPSPLNSASPGIPYQLFVLPELLRMILRLQHENVSACAHAAPGSTSCLRILASPFR